MTTLQAINFTEQPVAYCVKKKAIIRAKVTMDDGHGKLPLVVLYSTTMASKRQYIFTNKKFYRINKNEK